MKKIIPIVYLTILILFANNSAFAEGVIYNTQTQKVHKTSCLFAKKCTKNCIKTERSDAYKRGGKPCQKCGG